MRATHLLFLALLALQVTAVSVRADDGEMRAEIQEVLQQRHPNDTDAWWRALGPDAPGVIIAMYQESSNMLHKIHLLQGLSAFKDSQQAVDFLKGETKSPTSVIRGAAVGSLGASQGEKAMEALAEALQHEDAQTRFAAAKAIHRIGTPGSSEVLKAYLKTEKVDWISRQVLADEKPQGLKPVDRPPPDAREPRPEDYAGVWKGFWISPNGAEKPQLLSVAASATIRTVKPARPTDKIPFIEGEIATGSRILALRAAKLQGGRWQGMVQQTSPVRAQPVPNAGEIQLSRYKKGWTLVLRVPATGETAVFVKP